MLLTRRVPGICILQSEAFNPPPLHAGWRADTTSWGDHALSRGEFYVEDTA